MRPPQLRNRVGRQPLRQRRQERPTAGQVAVAGRYWMVKLQTDCKSNLQGFERGLWKKTTMDIYEARAALRAGTGSILSICSSTKRV